jgi:hypothetical protein
MKNQYSVSLLILAVGSTFAAETDSYLLRASAVLDRALIPALAATGGRTDGDAVGLVARLAEAWPAFHSGQGEVLSKVGGWSLIHSGVTRRIELAGKFAASDDVGLANVLLSQVRVDLVRIRTALEAGYFVDLLVLFQETMDSILGAENRRLGDVDQQTMINEITDLRDRWKAIHDTEVDAETYGFLWKELKTLGDLLAVEGNAIRLLRRAVVSGDIDDLDHLADGVRKGFFDVYMMFGATE